jgi:hypothetical protein
MTQAACVIIAGLVGLETEQLVSTPVVTVPPTVVVPVVVALAIVPEILTSIPRAPVLGVRSRTLLVALT